MVTLRNKFILPCCGDTRYYGILLWFRYGRQFRTNFLFRMTLQDDLMQLQSQSENNTNLDNDNEVNISNLFPFRWDTNLMPFIMCISIMIKSLYPFHFCSLHAYIKQLLYLFVFFEIVLPWTHLNKKLYLYRELNKWPLTTTT